MKVKDVMHTGVVWAEPDVTVSEIARMMRDEDVGAIPVGENDRLIGIVTDRDIICRGVAEGGDIGSLTAREIMSKPIVYSMTEEDIEDAVHVMEKNGIRRMPVIDDDMRMVGMLTLGDIAARAGKDLSAETVHAVAQHHV